MDFRAFKTWHWMLIALLIGLVVGLVRDLNRSEIHGLYVDGFGYFLGDQKRFEDALTTEIDGQRRFHDITVYPRQIRDAHGESKQVYLVKGMYYGGPPQTVEGRAQGGWQPTFFIAPIPYDPLLDFSTLDKPGSPDWSKAFRGAGLEPTVLDFLFILHAAAGVNYRYAWWDSHPVATSMLISFILFGLIWPLLINLLAFKTFRKPPEAKTLSLWKVRNPKVLHIATNVPMLSGESDSPEPRNPEHSQVTTETSEDACVVSVLPADDAIAPPTMSNHDSREFDLREEDFYPTERRLPAHDE